uniref:Large ribosomal subunit protein uL2 C-terminal domain-containing protein n=1 Tax=Manihot esculenta TaxID=3983 RepID=A0A2C9VMM4_MANES
MMKQMAHLDINAQVGTCMPLASMRIGTLIYNIEMNPGQGGKLVRAAGSCAKILKEPTSKYCLVKLPSGAEKLIDSQCRATIDRVSLINFSIL